MIARNISVMGVRVVCFAGIGCCCGCHALGIVVSLSGVNWSNCRGDSSRDNIDLCESRQLLVPRSCQLLLLLSTCLPLAVTIHQKECATVWTIHAARTVVGEARRCYFTLRVATVSHCG